MTTSNKILSEITIFNKYAKYNPDLKRRETWDEICNRYELMMISKYPNLQSEITNSMEFVRSKRVLPSMRAMQFAGTPIFKNESRIYNCAYLPVDDYRAFNESMFLLLGGTGVGFSVQKHHIDKLPPISKPTKEKKYMIADSLEGWADAIKVLVKSYFGYNQYKPKFNYTDIRNKGMRLITAGGKAPGPEPLKIALTHLEAIFERKQNDYDMMECKFGNWWELNPQRGRANNSAVLEREVVTEEKFKSIWKKIELSGSGEPGVYWTNNKDWGTNPCCEIALKPFQFCNLCEVNVSDVVNQEDLNMRVGVAAFFGTLQAGYTDFHYLRAIWRKTTEEDALIGVGMTGIASGKVLDLDLVEAADIVKKINKIISNRIKINSAARATTIKPSGTTSCVLGTSSGIHAWHNDYYFRRIRVTKNDPLYGYMFMYHNEIVEDDQLKSHDTAIITIPQEAPTGSILRTESVLDLLNRISKLYSSSL